MFLSDELIVSLVSLGVLAISEVLPLLPVEANGILEGFLLLFKACKRTAQSKDKVKFQPGRTVEASVTK